MEEQEQFFELVENNKKLATELKKANNMRHATITLMIYLAVVSSIMLMRVMGWI